MAEALDIEHLKSFMECSICLDKFDNPKQLKCNHHFCKQCLEDIIEFKGDGSATITCPMRCTTQTIISANETVNNLSASYELKGMLEVFKAEDDDPLDYQIPTCTYVGNCTKVVSVFCCEQLLCSSCYAVHKKVGEVHRHQSKVNLSFNKRQNKLKALCDEHVSDCTHVDMEGDKFVCCLYCLHRDNFEVRTPVDDLAILIRMGIKNTSSRSICKFLKCTEEGIILSKQNFDDLLRKRKEECLSHYNDILNKQEEVLKSQFQNICDNHLEQYGDVTPEYYENLLSKHDIELVILNQRQVSVEKSSLNCETISLSDHFNFLSGLPLGCIEVVVSETVLVSDAPVSTIKTKANESSATPALSENRNSSRKLATNYEEKGEPQKQCLHSESDPRLENVATEDVSCDVENLSLNSDAPIPIQPPQEQELVVNNGETKSKHKKKKKKKSKKQDKIVTNPTIDRVQTFFDIEIDDRPIGRLIMTMFEDIAPKTCQNFIQLCTHEKGFGYKGSLFHYIYAEAYCEGGDITNGDGSGGISIYGKNFECENFTMQHKERGIVSMTNQYLNGFTNSIFSITVRDINWYDGLNVGFGKVTDQSYHVLEKIMKNRDGHFLGDIVIVDCGIL